MRLEHKIFMSSTSPMPALVLASSSAYRRELLTRLGLPFEWAAPDVDETRQAGEPPAALVRRLALAKARALAARFPRALVLGSDQVAVIDGQVLGKPGTAERAVAQLGAAAGRTVDFLTSVCLLDTASGDYRLEVVPCAVRFRRLSRTQIEAYVAREQPLDCAGSFKSEGLGIALFEALQTPDPTALVGLPLTSVTRLLAAAGLDVLSPADAAARNEL